MMNAFEEEIAVAEAQWAQAETLEEIWHARARLEAAYGPEDDWVRACRAQGIDPAGIPLDDGPVGSGEATP